MLRRKRNEGEAVESTALPADVLAVMEATTFHHRQPDADGAPRLVVQFAGRPGWIHGHDDAKHLAAAWPELTEAQVKRACHYLAALVRNHLRTMAHDGQPQRTNWVNKW